MYRTFTGYRAIIALLMSTVPLHGVGPRGASTPLYITLPERVPSQHDFIEGFVAADNQLHLDLYDNHNHMRAHNSFDLNAAYGLLPALTRVKLLGLASVPSGAVAFLTAYHQNSFLFLTAYYNRAAGQTTFPMTINLADSSLEGIRHVRVDRQANIHLSLICQGVNNTLQLSFILRAPVYNLQPNDLKSVQL